MSDVIIQFNHFDELLKLMLDNIESTIDETAHSVADEAAGAVEVHTGAEKVSFYVSDAKGSTYADAASAAQGDNPDGYIQPEVMPEGKGEAIIGAAEEYAEYQEFGTSHMPAHPALIPALENHRQTLLSKLEEGLFNGE
ncbi:MAG: HK97-gp10 family putative phage morphogenesis protein [Ktedonobacterales bacterium]